MKIINSGPSESVILPNRLGASLLNYIDLHNHILPAIDDGPRSMAQSVALARPLVSAGFDTVVATPHTCEGRPEPAVILENLRGLQDELNRLEIPLKVLPGSEQHIEPKTLELLKAGKILTLNHTRYLLLELPMFQPLPLYTEELIFSLATNGYIPVIPHPERTRDLLEDPGLVYSLHKAGALYQVTWGALTGMLGPPSRQLAYAMLEAKLAHLFSTDAHDVDSHLLGLEQAASALEDSLGPGSAETFLSARPRALLTDKKLDLPAASEIKITSRLKTPFIDKLRRSLGH